MLDIHMIHSYQLTAESSDPTFRLAHPWLYYPRTSPRPEDVDNFGVDESEGYL